MLNILDFVRGSVAKKDFQPALMHFHIKNGMVQGYNGVLSICSPIGLDFDVSPNAIQFVKAIQQCRDTIALSMTAGGRLAVKSGRFKAYIECSPGGLPEIKPKGKEMPLPDNFLDALAMLEPCVAEDASRQWARGILFRGKSAYATNNVVLVEYFLGSEFPTEMNIPAPSVAELLRIGEKPRALLADTNTVTFLYPGDRWLRTQLYINQWPDVDRILNGASKATPSVLNIDALEAITPFLDPTGRVYFLEDTLSTSSEDGIGARIEVPGLQKGGIFSAHMLRLVLERAETVDYTGYPGPCRFFGPQIRGALVGIRG